MMRPIRSAAVVATLLVLSGSARGQLIGGMPYGGPSFGALGLPDGLYKSIPVPGMGGGGPGLWMYFPSTGQGGFTPTPMAGSVIGLQLPVAGSGGSVYLPSTGAGVPTMARGVGGLGLPNPSPPVRPVATPAAPAARPVAAKKAARAEDAPARAGAPAEDDARDKASEARSTLKSRRGIR